MTAFIAPLSTRFFPPLCLQTLQSRCRHSHNPSRSTRRKLRACAIRDSSNPSPEPSRPDDRPPEGSPPENPSPESPTPTTSSDDAQASDLKLPNLRELFVGAGRSDCEQCKGKGEIACLVCDAKGFVSLTMMETVSSTQCRLCHGLRSVPCPSCREEVYRSVLWWDRKPNEADDPHENWREGPDGEPRISWGENPAAK